MILFLTDRGEGRRGGEEDNARLFEFFKNNYENIVPERLTEITGKLKSPWHHAKYKLKSAKESDPELVVIDISGAFRNILALRWLKRHGRKVMTVFLGQRMSFRYNSWPVKKAVRICENYVLRNSDIIFVNSEFTAGIARRNASSESRIVVVRPGTTMISKGGKLLDTAARNRQKPVRLLFVGALTKVKGLEYLVEALSRVGSPDFKLGIAGEYNDEDPYCRKIKKIIADAGIIDRVDFFGFVQPDRLSEYYRNSSIYILPSLSEGYGRSLAEAMSFGLPIIASNVGAVPELVKEGENAFLVKPGNPEALAEALVRLASDPGKMDEMSRANLDKSKTIQTWETYDEDLRVKLVPVISEVAGIYPAKKRREEENKSK